MEMGQNRNIRDCILCYEYSPHVHHKLPFASETIFDNAMLIWVLMHLLDSFQKACSYAINKCVNKPATEEYLLQITF